MKHRSRKILYAALSLMSLSSTFFVAVPTQAHASEKVLNAYPKQLRGYWYNRVDGGYVYLYHITKHGNDQRHTSFKNLKKALNEYKHTPHKSIDMNESNKLGRKLKMNKTFTVSQAGKKRWVKRISTSFHKKHTPDYSENHDVYAYYLQGSKKRPVLYIDWLNGSTSKVFKKPVPKHHQRGDAAVTRVSAKVLRSVGIYK